MNAMSSLGLAPIWSSVRRTIPAKNRASPILVLALANALAGPPPTQAQQTGSVVGTVVAAHDQRPVATVQVSIAETSLGTLTGSDGRYLIVGVPVGEVEVEARSLGYGLQSVTATVTANQATTVDFSLTVSAIELEEIVATGTPVAARRRELGNAVTSLETDQIVATAALTSVPELLNGRVSGLVAMAGTGVLGAGPRLKIRGTASLALDDQPLIYVDGVRVNNDIGAGPNSQGYGAGVISRLGDFAPDEIERIEVVKGPAAATLYGTEASNGVIQIFTKRGARGAPARWSLKVEQGANWLHDPEGTIPPIWGRDASGAVTSWNLFQRETDAGNNVFRTGYEQSYGLSVTGGESNISYFVSGAYDTGQGVYITNNVARFNGRANIDFSPSETWNFGASAGYVRSNIELADDIGAGPLLSGMYAFPSLVDTPNRGWLIAPPEVLYDREQNRQELDRFTGSFRVQHTPFEWLQQRLVVGIDETAEENIVQRPFLGPAGALFYGPSGARGGREFEKLSATFTTVDYAGTASVGLTDNLTAETSVGVQYYAREVRAAQTSGQEFAAPGLTTVSSTARRFADESFVRNVTVGTFIQEHIGWKDRLFVTGAVRVDNNSAFGDDFDFVAYPKVSASWVISEEAFWDLGFVNSLKLRAAFGQTGQQPESFSALRFFLPVTTGLGTPGLAPSSPGNSELAPERGIEYEAGLEGGLLGDRLGVDLTYYHQNIRDVLLQRLLAPSSGFPGVQWVNVGEVESRGFELSLDGAPIRSQDVSWDVGFQISRNWNKVIDLGGVQSGTTSGGNAYLILDTMLDTPGLHIRHQVGLPPGSWFGQRVVSADFDANGNAVNLMCDGGSDRAPVPCNQAPAVYLGPTEPEWEGGVSTSLTLFGNLTLSGLVDFKYGQRHGDNDTIVRCQLFRICRENLVPTDYDPVLIGEFDSGLYSSFAVADAGFAKLRQTSLSYSLPRQWAESFGAGNATVTLAAYNLMTWTNWPSLDPETYFTEPTSTSPLFDKSSQSFTPMPRRVKVSVRVDF